jgi:hypothetical protein
MEQLGVFYREVEQHGAEGGYQVEHSGSVVLFDPLGRPYAVFPAPHQPRTVTTTYLELRTRSQAIPAAMTRFLHIGRNDALSTDLGTVEFANTP